MRSVHQLTEMLEFFDWDEKRCNQAIDILVGCAHEIEKQKIIDLVRMEAVLENNLKQKGLTTNEAKFLIRQLKSYLKNNKNEQVATQ